MPVLSNIYEKAMHKRLYEYLLKCGFLSKTQFGLRTAHSTLHALEDLMGTVNSELDKRNFCISIFIDFKKAFDTVDFSILLKDYVA